MDIGVINHSFSIQLPSLQLVVDSTSLGEFKTCPRKYYYRMIEGWVPKSTSVHLTFGILLHQGRETYEHAKASGLNHEDSLRAAVRASLASTWDKETGRPWWSNNPDKNRYTLIRTLVHYLDTFGRDDRLQTVILSNGKPAIELSFKFVPVDLNSGEEFKSVTGEQIYFSGHLDRIVSLEENQYISDVKTTSSALNSYYFSRYSPDNQFSMYTLAGMAAFQTQISGIICDAIKVKAEFNKFERQLIPRTPDQIHEWLGDTKYYLSLMGRMAEAGRWPQNDKACHFYGGCPYRPVCSRTPGARQTWLEADYTKSIWDPSIARGEENG